VIRELQDFGCDVDVSDYWADKDEVKREYGLDMVENPDFSEYSAIVLAVAHDKYKALDFSRSGERVIYDIKSTLDDSISDGRL